MGAIKDITGRTYGRLTVKGFSHLDAGGAMWSCKCSCGNAFLALGSSLRSGNTTSCGCKKREAALRASEVGVKHRHSQRNSPTYRSWVSARNRCNNPNNVAYDRYGGAGIEFCEKWEDFETFLADMGERPEGTTLDRIENDKGYEQGNCRWATRIEQENNKSCSHFIEFGGKRLTKAQWSRETGISVNAINYRLSKGKTLEEVFRSEKVPT